MLALSSTIFLWSCSTIRPFLDVEGDVIKGSIAEYEDVEIGGVKQSLFIRGINQSNPILLFIHGGPGTPYDGLAYKFQPGHLSELQPVNAVNTKGQFFRASFGKIPRFQIQLDKRPLSPGTSREASGVPCLNPRRGLTLRSPVCRGPAIGV